MTATIIADAIATAFSLTMDLLYKLGQVDEATLENAKQLAIARIQNYPASEALQRAKEWRIANGAEP